MTFLVGVNSHQPCPLTFRTRQFYYHGLIASVGVWTHKPWWGGLLFSAYAYFTSSIKKTVFPKLHTVGVGTTSEEELLKSVFFYSLKLLYSVWYEWNSDVLNPHTVSVIRRHSQVQLLFYSLVGLRKLDWSSRPSRSSGYFLQCFMNTTDFIQATVLLLCSRDECI